MTPVPRTNTKRVALFLAALLLVPSVFFLTPVPRAYADVMGVPVGDWTTEIKSTLTAIEAGTSAAANWSRFMNTYFLQPLAFIEAGNLSKEMTAAAVAFVIGKTSGTGSAQFVTNLQQTYQTVADSQALSMLNQVANSHMTFASAIEAELGSNYEQNTTLAGYWAENMDLLQQTSPNPNAYLGGNWSEGGTAAWFALTTDLASNPYTMSQQTKAALANDIGPGAGGVTGARAQELAQNNGFMGWCGSAGTNTYSDILNGVGIGPTTKSGSTSGANPGDPCINADGTPGVIKTPGSVIEATLNKELGAKQDQVTRMGDVSAQINDIIGNFTTVLQTVKIATALLGGPDNSGGLLGSADNGVLGQFTDTSNGNLGITEGDIYQNMASTTLANGSGMKTRVSDYMTAWDTIKASANVASTTLQALTQLCLSSAQSVTNEHLQNTSTSTAFRSVYVAFVDTATSTAASSTEALATEVAPVFAEYTTASSTASAALALIAKTQNDLQSGSTTAYDADIQQMQAMSPTASDVANAQGNARTMGAAMATPPGSLTVASDSSTIVDQMNLLTANANELASSTCSIKSLNDTIAALISQQNQ